MSDIICITNRNLCEEKFLTRIEKIAKAHPYAVILREKDLSEKEYQLLAKAVLEICNKYGTPCILHSFINAANKLGCKSIHLPLPVLRSLNSTDKEIFTVIGASCHSVQDAMEAQTLGCTYLTAGHVFDTNCKKGLPGRGIDFLKSVCENVSIPVFALGGINTENIIEVRNTAVNGICVMSGGMNCEEPEKYFTSLKE